MDEQIETVFGPGGVGSEFAADSPEADDSLNLLIHSLRAALARTKRVGEPEAPRK